MRLWHRDSQIATSVTDGGSAASGTSPGYEEKRQRALKILGERWLLHRANAPDRRPVNSVLGRGRGFI